MGFSNKWIQWIMLCVSTVSYSVCFNGTNIGPINPKCGLRQGDPLSPYLFLFCVEGLSLALRDAANVGRISGCKVCADAPAVTHLLFADASFLFFKAQANEVGEVTSILSRYELLSGQAINFQKSGIFFSANVSRDKQEEFKELLGVRNDLSEGNYLGLPSLIGRSKKRVFSFLKDRVGKRIQSWNSKLLSKAGKAVLIRNVAQAIPSYCMSCFLIPKSLCSELEIMMNGYWWKTNSATDKGIRWHSWKNLSMAKDSEGLGFRDLHGFNIGLLGKHVWQFISRPEALVSRVFKARYFPQTSILKAGRGGVLASYGHVYGKLKRPLGKVLDGS